MDNDLFTPFLIDSKNDQEEKLAQSNVTFFDAFHKEVKAELNEWLGKIPSSDIRRSKLLNGGANVAAFSLIPEITRKKYGIFFSGHEVSNLVASKISSRLLEGATVVDPACGAGDLLIACARQYPRQTSYYETLNYWAEHIAGIDLYESFLKTVDARLCLLGTEFHGILETESAFTEKGRYFHLLEQGNALSKLAFVKNYDCVVTNPPYGYIDAPQDIDWATGKVQLAGLFVDKMLENSPHGQEIVAVLPDVLRSGSRYKRWRDKIAQHADIISSDVFGKFDKTTDVDVFILHLKSTSTPVKGWDNFKESVGCGNTISDYFKVNVGPVVPHRHKDDGIDFPFVDCTVTSGMPECKPTKKIKFAGTKYEAPFVAIHRTSSPDDKNRLVSSIVISKEPVAVENHLIIVKPIDGKYSTCKSLVEQLKTQKTTDWVNSRIRCRHITVAAIKELPIDSSLFDI